MYQETIQEYVKQCYKPPPKSSYVIFNGNTSCGKSTLINYLLGVKLIWKKKGSYYEITPDPSEKGKIAEIGNNRESCTRSACPYQKDGITYVDTPGNKTTRGNDEQLFNTIADDRLFLQGRKIKQVLVVNYNDLLSAKGNEFIEFISQFLKRYDQAHLPLAFYSTILVFSQATSDYTTDDFHQILEELLMQSHISEILKSFLIILKEKNRILCFPCVKLKTVFEEVQKIKETISSLDQMELLYDLPPVPSNSVQLMIKGVLNSFYGLLEKVCNDMSKLITEQSKNIEKKKLEKQLQKFKKIKSYFQSDRFSEEPKMQTQCFSLLNLQRYKEKFFMCLSEISYLGSFLPNFQFNDEPISKVLNSIDFTIRKLVMELTELKNEKEIKEMEYKMEEQFEKQFNENMKMYIEQRKKEEIENERRMKVHRQKMFKLHQEQKKIFERNSRFGPQNWNYQPYNQPYNQRNYPNQNHTHYNQGNNAHTQPAYQNNYPNQYIQQKQEHYWFDPLKILPPKKKIIYRGRQSQNGYLQRRINQQQQRIYQQPRQQFNIPDLRQYEGFEHDPIVCKRKITQLQKIISQASRELELRRQGRK